MGSQRRNRILFGTCYGALQMFPYIYFPKIRAITIVVTVKFIPRLIPIPELKLDDYLQTAADDIVTLLAKPPATTIPSLQAGEETNLALTSLAKILRRVKPFPTQSTDLHPVKHKARQTRVLPTNINSNTHHTNSKDISTPNINKEAHFINIRTVEKQNSRKQGIT